LQSTSFGTAKHSIVSFNAMSKGVTWSNMILLIPIHTLLIQFTFRICLISYLHQLIWTRCIIKNSCR
ncbi:hypothetical protein T4D_3712, partial [Trichinella pseudospiralis]